MLKDIIKVIDRVEYILRNYLSSRDNDKKLYLRYILEVYDIKDCTMAIDVFNIILHKKTPSFESISRARRKIQEHNPELRGKNYKERKKEQEKVREWVGY